MAAAGSPNRWVKTRAWGWLVAILALAGPTYLLWRKSHTARPVKAATPAELVAAMARGERGAVERARAAAGTDRTMLAALAQDAFSHAEWQARVAGCDLLSGPNAGRWLPLLLPRTSDADWHVRMRAYGILADLGAPPSGLPLRNTPIDHRERWLLAWLDQYDARTGNELGGQLCEIYAGAAWVEFGRPMAERCLGCHAGPTLTNGVAAVQSDSCMAKAASGPPHSKAPFSASDACAACHTEVYAQWARTAHAQSLSHLHLLTPSTTQPQAQWMDFGEVKGIGCAECHRVTGRRSDQSGSTRPAETQPAPRGCAYTFDAALPAAASCARCHASIEAQWKVWRSGPQPRRPEWPPGQVDVDVRGDERTCVDCHMPKMLDGGSASLRDHRWGVRRDLERLRSGIDLRVLPSDDAGACPHFALKTIPAGTSVDATNDRSTAKWGLTSSPTREAGAHEMRLVLTNLAGHAFPTGTRRRAVRLYACDSSQAELPAVLTLSPEGGLVLRPGEQKTVTVPLPVDAESGSYRMVFVRDQWNPQSYTVEIVSGSVRMPGSGVGRAPAAAQAAEE